MMTSFIPHFPETAASGRKSAGALRPLSPGIRRALSTVLLTLALSVLGILLPAGAAPVQAMHNGKTVIVLDPGHGGSDIGANYAPYVEKAMTLCTAIYLYQELSQYDNVEVYLTRTEDKDVSLTERVDFAHSVNADFLLSLHFNAVGTGEVKSGSMILPSAFGSLYSQECSYGLLNLQQLSAIGLKSHGFWTRLGRTGADYFGIIRRSTNYNMPAVITEHCFLDNENDRKFLAQPDSYQKLAHADATALAQYLHLQSTALGVNYSGYARPVIQTPPAGVPVLINPIP